LAVEPDVGGGVGEERAGAGLALGPIDLAAVQRVSAIIGEEGQVDDDAERPLALAAEGPWLGGFQVDLDMAFVVWAKCDSVSLA
jgi:hypothetical protein